MHRWTEYTQNQAGPPIALHTSICCDIVREEKGHRLPAPKLHQSTPKAGADSVQKGKRDIQQEG